MSVRPSSGSVYSHLAARREAWPAHRSGEAAKVACPPKRRSREGGLPAEAGSREGGLPAEAAKPRRWGINVAASRSNGTRRSRMTRRIFAVAALVAALGTIPTIAQGQGPGGGFGPGPQGRGRGPGGPGPGGPGGPNLLAMVNQLDLSDAQRQQLRQIMEEARRAGDPGAGVREAEKKLHEAVLA